MIKIGFPDQVKKENNVKRSEKNQIKSDKKTILPQLELVQNIMKY